VDHTACPTRYRTRHFFNNSNITQGYVRCVRNEEECVCSAPNCCDTEQRSASQLVCFLPDAGFGSEWDTLYKESNLLLPDVDVGFSATEFRTQKISFLKGKQHGRKVGPQYFWTAVFLFLIEMPILITLFRVE
jgi:hypothetical protein